MIVYIENPVVVIKQQQQQQQQQQHQKLNPISEFGNAVGYKFIIQNMVAFLYTKNEISEMETWKISHLL